MKKLLIIAIFSSFTYFGAVAQTSPGNSAYGHSHKKTKKAKKHYTTTVSTSTQRKAINTKHRTAVKSAQSNDVLTNQQQRDLVKQANTTHKQEMKAVKPAKNK